VNIQPYFWSAILLWINPPISRIDYIKTISSISNWIELIFIRERNLFCYQIVYCFSLQNQSTKSEPILHFQQFVVGKRAALWTPNHFSIKTLAILEDIYKNQATKKSLKILSGIEKKEFWIFSRNFSSLIYPNKVEKQQFLFYRPISNFILQST